MTPRRKLPGWPGHRARMWGLVSVCVLAAGIWATEHRGPAASKEPAALQAAEVDRLRMKAAGASDASALEQLQQAARHGNVDAMRAAASVMIAGKDKSSVERGLQWALRAAQQGDRGAQYLLGKTLFEGSAWRLPERENARAWLEKSAVQQHSQAAYLLGLIYKNGYGIGIDEGAAVRWFERAADLGNPDAMFMLGNAYLAGEGVALDQAHAVRLYRAAAELEHPLASQMLGYALRDGTLGLARDSRQSQEMMVEVEHALKHPREVL